jgi:hypothetical protein
VWWGVVVVVLVVFFLFFLCLCFSGCVVVVCVVCCSYKLQGKECKLFVATYFADDDRTVTVRPVAVKGDVDWSSLYVADDGTGYGMWQQDGDDRWFIDVVPVNGYDLWHDSNALKITGVYGLDGDDWEACANDFLADYGFRLGRFDEVKGDRFELVAL